MKLFFRKYGEGNPVIILHGLFGMSDNWVSIGKKISENGYCVYIPDQRNHGSSPHSDEFSYKLLGEDITEFIKQESILNPVIIGHSMGGKAAMIYALANRYKIQKLIIVDIGIKKYPVHDMEIIDALLSVKLEIANSRSDIENDLSMKIPEYRIVQLLMKNLSRNVDNTFEWKLNLKSIRENLPSLFVEIQNNNEPFQGNTLFIKGEKSSYIKESDMKEIKNVFPNSIFKTIPGASHWVHADNPEVFLQEVIQFLHC